MRGVIGALVSISLAGLAGTLPPLALRAIGLQDINVTVSAGGTVEIDYHAFTTVSSPDLPGCVSFLRLAAPEDSTTGGPMTALACTPDPFFASINASPCTYESPLGTLTDTAGIHSGSCSLTHSPSERSAKFNMQRSSFSAGSSAPAGIVTYQVQAVEQNTEIYSNVATVTITIESSTPSSGHEHAICACNGKEFLRDKTEVNPAANFAADEANVVSFAHFFVKTFVKCERKAAVSPTGDLKCTNLTLVRFFTPEGTGGTVEIKGTATFKIKFRNTGMSSDIRRNFTITRPLADKSRGLNGESGFHLFKQVTKGSGCTTKEVELKIEFDAPSGGSELREGVKRWMVGGEAKTMGPQQEFFSGDPNLLNDNESLVPFAGGSVFMNLEISSVRLMAVNLTRLA